MLVQESKPRHIRSFRCYRGNGGMISKFESRIESQNLIKQRRSAMPRPCARSGEVGFDVLPEAGVQRDFAVTKPGVTRHRHPEEPQKYEGGVNAVCNVEFERAGIATSLLRYIRHFRTSNFYSC